MTAFRFHIVEHKVDIVIFDTGAPACGDLPECKICEWYHLITSVQKCTTT